MKSDNCQGDLFGQEMQDIKARKPGFFDKYTAQRFLPQVKISIEYIIIILISILLLVILSYAVGVEVGKRSLPGDVRKSFIDSTEVVEPEKIEVVERIEFIEKIEEPIVVPENVAQAVQEKPAKEKVKTPAKPSVDAYVIQIASFKKEQSAKDEIAKLKAKGIKVFIETKGEWYIVRAGGYPTIDKAREALNRLREFYKDCYIRKVE